MTDQEKEKWERLANALLWSLGFSGIPSKTADDLIAAHAHFRALAAGEVVLVTREDIKNAADLEKGVVKAVSGGDLLWKYTADQTNACKLVRKLASHFKGKKGGESHG